MKPSIIFLLPLLAAGCVVARPYARETTVGTNGAVVTRELRLTTFAIWPGTITVEKQRASIGKTLSLGAINLDADSGGTNMIEALKYIDSILGKIR